MKWYKVFGALSVTWIFICATAVYGDYVVIVQTHNYTNPGSLLTDGTCCDLNVTKSDGSCAIPGCDIYFYYCIRNGSLGLSQCRTSQILFNTERLAFSEPMAFAGLPNPLYLRGLAREWNSVQFRLEVHEADNGSSSGVVGRVVYDIALPIGVESRLITFLHPQPDRSSIVLSFEVVCAENYYGRDCSQYCNASSSCTCEPGFTGEFCHKRDYCFGVNCSENGQCLDGEDDYSCECIPGFTGANCQEDIDECVALNINCSGHGLCVNGVNNYSCVCDNGFTGSTCRNSKPQVVTDEEVSRGEARLLVAAGVVGGLLAGGLIIVAILAILIVFLVCIRRSRSGSHESGSKTGGKTVYRLNNQPGDSKSSLNDCKKEYQTNTTYMNIPNQNEELEHKFDNPIYNSEQNDSHSASNMPNAQVVALGSEEPRYEDVSAGDNMYSAIGPASNHTVTESLEYKFDNPIYGNENETQYDSPLELNAAESTHNEEKVDLDVNGSNVGKENRNSRNSAPYETIAL